MEIDSIDQNPTIKKFSKLFSKKIAKEIVNSIYKFSKQYVEENGTPFLLESIYDNKVDELLCNMDESKNGVFLTMVKEGKIDAKTIAYLRPEEMNPEMYEKIIKKKELEEYKKNKKTGTNAFKCSKCKSKNCSVSQKQTRSGD